MPARFSQHETDKLWDSVSTYDQNMLLYARKRSSDQADCVAQRKIASLPKGVLKMNQRYPQYDSLDDSTNSFRIRKLRNFLAPVKERMKLESLELTHLPEYHRLVLKTTASPLYKPQLTTKQHVSELEAQLPKERDKQRLEGLRKWRSKLLRNSVSACYSWLKISSPMPFFVSPCP